jgi:CRP-like cAMP-binding protein
MESNFESNFFALLERVDAGSRLEIDAACSRQSFRHGDIIYRQGEQSTSVYIVAAGVVEVLTESPDGRQTRSVGFMKRGDFFGDLAVLTGRPRLGTARACEDTQLFQIEKPAYLNLLERIPKMGAYFTRNLARRLHKTSTEAHLNIYSLDLTGNLHYFDLLTIFQAITSTRRSGELHLNNSANEIIGSFFFREGRAEHARFVHLEGLEAIWEGFLQSATEGTFTFQVVDHPLAPYDGEKRIELESCDLLIQGAMRRDAYQALPASLRSMEGSLGARAGAPAQTVPLKDAAARIRELIARRPQPLASLWRRVPYSSLTFLEAVNELIGTGDAVLVDTPSPGDTGS